MKNRSMKNSFSKDYKEELSSNDEINFNLLYKFFNRNIKNISKISFVFFLVTCKYSFGLKRIWRGEFQIVLNSEVNESFRRASDINLSKLIGTSEGLNTQVGILKSPSILIPVYEFVIAKKNLDTKKINSFLKSGKKIYK